MAYEAKISLDYFEGTAGHEIGTQLQFLRMILRALVRINEDAMRTRRIDIDVIFMSRWFSSDFDCVGEFGSYSDIVTILKRGSTSAMSLAAARVAELHVRDLDAKADVDVFCNLLPNGARQFGVFVARSNDLDEHIIPSECGFRWEPRARAPSIRGLES